MANAMVDLALQGADESYHEGAEDGYWAGFRAGLEANRQYIMGERTVNPWDDIPEAFRPLGHRYYRRV